MTDLIPEEREKERIIHCLLKINEFTFQFKMSNGEVLTLTWTPHSWCLKYMKTIRIFKDIIILYKLNFPLS